jgi:hypothetical protein
MCCTVLVYFMHVVAVRATLLIVCELEQSRGHIAGPFYLNRCHVINKKTKKHVVDFPFFLAKL